MKEKQMDETIIELQIGLRRVKFAHRGGSMHAIDEQPKPAQSAPKQIIGVGRRESFPEI